MLSVVSTVRKPRNQLAYCFLGKFKVTTPAHFRVVSQFCSQQADRGSQLAGFRGEHLKPLDGGKQTRIPIVTLFSNKMSPALEFYIK